MPRQNHTKKPGSLADEFLNMGADFEEASLVPVTSPAVDEPQQTPKRRNTCFPPFMVLLIAILSPLYTIGSLLLAFVSQMNAMQGFVLMMVALPDLLSNRSDIAANSSETTFPAVTNGNETSLAITTANPNASDCFEYEPLSVGNIVGTTLNSLNALNYLFIIQLFSYLLVTFRKMAEIQKYFIQQARKKPSRRSRCQTINCREIGLHTITTVFIVFNFALYVVKSIVINMENDSDDCGSNYFLSLLQLSWEIILGLAILQDSFSVSVRYHFTYEIMGKLCSSKCCKKKKKQDGFEPARPDDKRSYNTLKATTFITSTTLYVFIQTMSMYNLLKMFYGSTDADRSDEPSVIVDITISAFLALFNVLPGALNSWGISDKTGEPFFQNWCNRDRKNNFGLKLSTFVAALQLFIFYFMGAYKSIMYNFAELDPLIAIGLSLVPAVIGLGQALWFAGAEIAFQQLMDPTLGKKNIHTVSGLFHKNPATICDFLAEKAKATAEEKAKATTVASLPAISAVTGDGQNGEKKVELAETTFGQA